MTREIDDTSPNEAPFDKRLLWTTLAIVALSASGIGAKKAFDYFKQKRMQLGDPDNSIDELLGVQLESIDSEAVSTYGNPRRNIVRNVAHLLSRTHGNEHDNPSARDIRLVNNQLHPLRDLAQSIGFSSDGQMVGFSDWNEDYPVQGEGYTDLDLLVLRRFLSQVDMVRNEIHDDVTKERRRQLDGKGLRVVQPRDHQWSKVGSMLEQNWNFPKLRNLRHGIRENVRAPFGPRVLIEPDGWLAIRKYEGEILGYASFLTLAHIDPDVTELSTFTFEDAMNQRISADEARGNTIMLTSVAKRRNINNPDPMEGLMYGIKDYARQNGVQNVLAPSLSPFVRLQQHRDMRKGIRPPRTYEELWGDLDLNGRPTDPWRRLLTFFSERELGYNPRFMEFEIGVKQILDLVAKQRNIGGITNVHELLDAETVFLDASPVPLEKIAYDRWKCTVPAGWMLLYDRDIKHEEGVPLYSTANFP